MATRPALPRFLSILPRSTGRWPAGQGTWWIGLLLSVAASFGPIWAEEVGSDVEAEAIRAAIAKVHRSLVQIQTVGGLESVDGVLVSQAPTTGILVSAEGHILSSAFGFIHEPPSILARLHDQRQFAAELVARDRVRGLVLLKIDADTSLPLPTWLPRDEVQVGQTAIAVGMAFDAKTPNVSVGIVSARNRIWGRAIQADVKASPLNYGGPLIDLHGRVMGLLTPLTPDSDSVLAGAEWYDSGIAFAVPVSDLLQGQLEQMKQGKDLFPGLMGITLKGQNIYVEPAIVAHSQAKTPAREAGILPGDQIVALDGEPIERQSQLRHALGRKVAGDRVSIVALRGKDRLSFEVTLTDHIEPYDLPFMGILPGRATATEPRTGDDDRPAGIRVRFVYPKSPADQAGIMRGDVFTHLGGAPIETAEKWYAAVSEKAPGDELRLSIVRNGEELPMALALGRQPETLPSGIPTLSEALHAADEAAAPKGGADEDGELVPLRLPDEPNECFAWVPASAKAAGKGAGLLMWLAPPAKVEAEEFLGSWKAACGRYGFILLVPRPQDPSKWKMAELEILRRLLEQAVATFPVDSRRIAVGGYQVGGSLAYGFAFQQRERVRGVMAVDASLPDRIQPRGNDPENRLAFLLAAPPKSALEPKIAANSEVLRKIRFPVTRLESPSAPEGMNRRFIEDLVRWADTLDRL